MRVCSLFAGAGGIDLGLAQAGLKTVWANEIDYDACITYHQNFPDVRLVRGDIRTVDANQIPDFDLLAAGFPCQPFSIAGAQEGFAHTKGTLFFDICRILSSKKPDIVFLENVSNLVEHDGGKTFDIIMTELRKLGYSLKYAVMNASDYGVPQNRNRIYIVGFQDEKACARFFFPKPVKLGKTTATIINRTEPANQKLYLNRDSWQWKAMNQAIMDTTQIYRFHENGIRTSHNGICFTLLAGMGYWPNRVPIIRDNFGIRQLSPQECFLLQGFPETFDLSKTPVKSAYRQAGNSVCVPVIRMIAEEIIRATQEEINDTLVGFVRNKRQLEVSLANNFYHFPADKIPCPPEQIKYVALRLPTYYGEESGIRYIGKVNAMKIMTRSQITELPKESRTLYYKVKVEGWTEVAESDIKEKQAVFLMPASKIIK